MNLQSVVPNHEGKCAATWVNNNQIYRRLDGCITGFFRNVKSVWWWPFEIKTGYEFHGMIVDGEVRPTSDICEFMDDIATH